MSKRNVAFIKPDEPSFLQKLKQQAGYKEGPDINTKRQKVQDYDDSDEDFSDKEEESPQVVVLKEGDLTAEQADVEKKRIELEESQKKADLTERVIFKAKSKGGEIKEKSKKEKKAEKAAKSKLSFNDEDEEEEEV
ncbi:uncharacterized protein KIAA1143 homolog [Culicoides brevitarsis]|uniref:uncharacterized protein KIAA1143 homolog n=1 Tax=Culicoides brevitarsis TaxID=469753 RepID=UPI00307B9F80